MHLSVATRPRLTAPLTSRNGPPRSLSGSRGAATACQGPAAILDLVDDVARRLRTALELYEVGERMQLLRLRRTRPEASAEEIESEMGSWFRRRPGAEHGDFPGPRSRRFG